jgi:SAM-dependent methyltransferase
VDHRITVEGIPSWVDVRRLLAVPHVTIHADEGSRVRAECILPAAQAADLDARLRGIGLGGERLRVVVSPRLSRSVVRAARLVDARRRRDTTPGFERPGTRLDDEGRLSLTPEHLALQIAARIRGRSVLDAGCGAGGNAIAFAREGCRVVAVERDEARLALARHNAHVYGVHRAITFVHGDAAPALETYDVDVLFVDPPWGNAYDRERTVADAYPLLVAAWRVAERDRRGFLAKVPPSFDPDTLPGTAAEAFFGEAPGDRHRIKLVLLRARVDGAVAG